MKTRYLILVTTLVMASLTACQQGARSLKEAETLFEQGLEQRADKQTEKAAEINTQTALHSRRESQKNNTI